MIAEHFKLYDCTPYHARITEKSCKEQKAQALEEKKEGKFLSKREHCLTCKGVTGAGEVVSIQDQKKPKEVLSMTDELTCKKCKKPKSEDKRFNSKQELCNSCNVIRTQHKAKGKEDEFWKKIAPSGGEATAATTAKKEPPEEPADTGQAKAAVPVDNIRKRGIELAEGDTLTLDFSKHSEVYEMLSNLAEEELRPPENQLLYMLKKGIIIAKEKEATAA